MLIQRACALKILICLAKLPSVEEVPIFAPILSCIGVPISLYFAIKLFYLYQLKVQTCFSVQMLVQSQRMCQLVVLRFF